MARVMQIGVSGNSNHIVLRLAQELPLLKIVFIATNATKLLFRQQSDQIYHQDDRLNKWKKELWAKAPQQESEWILIPKSDPDPKKVSEGRHFRDKTISPQAEVYKHYADHYHYREAKALEAMTAALLNDVVNGEPRMLAPEGGKWNYLRCVEPNASRTIIDSRLTP